MILLIKEYPAERGFEKRQIIEHSVSFTHIKINREDILKSALLGSINPVMINNGPMALNHFAYREQEYAKNTGQENVH